MDSNKPVTGKDSATADAKKTEILSTKEWTQMKKPARRAFPGPQAPDLRLRVTFERSAYAEVIAHAKESLDREICGALAGEVCEDESGVFVDVKAALRGSGARQGSTHVTFTQETWNLIHEQLEKEHPKLGIVGWYHSHPGFGVEFSEMDRFIQKNFFPAPTQIALVTDPLGGDAAICINTGEGIQNLNRFWVDGREHACKAARMDDLKAGSGQESSPGQVEQKMQLVEQRLGQLIQAFDEHRSLYQRVLFTLFFVICLGFLSLIGYMIYGSFISRNEPPKFQRVDTFDMIIDGKTVRFGVGVVGVSLPPAQDPVLQRELLRRELEELHRQLHQSQPDPRAPAKESGSSPSQPR